MKIDQWAYLSRIILALGACRLREGMALIIRSPRQRPNAKKNTCPRNAPHAATAMTTQVLSMPAAAKAAAMIRADSPSINVQNNTAQ